MQSQTRGGCDRAKTADLLPGVKCQSFLKEEKKKKTSCITAALLGEENFRPNFAKSETSATGGVTKAERGAHAQWHPREHHLCRTAPKSRLAQPHDIILLMTDAFFGYCSVPCRTGKKRKGKEILLHYRIRPRAHAR